MKAIVYTEYGSPDVLHLAEVAQPVPADHEVLVRVQAVSVNYGDLIGRRFGKLSPREFNMPFFMWALARMAFGLSRPNNQILGSEFAGHIEAVGKDVTRFRAGDAVFGYRGQKMGSYAEYLTMPAEGLIAPLPPNMTCEQAAAVPYGALTALTLLRRARLQPGQRVLIIGASGAIGAAAVQLAKHDGAHVTGICGPTGLAYVKTLGADQVIDYTRQDYTRNGETYDLIFDVLGRGSFVASQKSLNPNGLYMLASFKMKQVFQMLRTSRSSGRKVLCVLSNEKPADLLHISSLIESGHYQSVIDRSFPRAQACEAHAYVESGTKQANVVITM